MLFFSFQYFVLIDGEVMKNKTFLIKVRPISLINIRIAGRRVRKHVRSY